jgi:hypothetical protein
MPGLVSIELTWEEILDAIKQKGFTLQKVQFVDAHYCQDPDSMKKNLFECGYFTAKKLTDKK